ncbi:MAG: ATP-binding cassette domain-containing protein [Peptostreptococcaceae bacterium]
MLKLKKVYKSFNDRKVLKNINLKLDGGLNFIVGPSGSGKSTLLKILSGIDKDYQGEVFYQGKNIKEFDSKELNSYYFNSVGFIWQNFQLLNHLSVEDNVKVVLQLLDLTEEEKDKKVKQMLSKLQIGNLADKKVGTLSGGQKQRVAIARALIKNPEIIIADEPTGALDKASSTIIMNILRQISKERTVIIVTHDKSLVDEESNCYLLKDGEIAQINKSEVKNKNISKIKKINPFLTLQRAIKSGITNFKGSFIKFIITSLVLSLSSYFLLLNISKTVVSEQQDILNQLIQENGDSLRDINMYSSVIGASGSGGDNSNKPNMDIDQDLSRVLDKYKDDERIEFLAPLHVINDMTVNIDGVLKDYKVENSNTSTMINKVVEGRVPKQSGKEVAVTDLFLKNTGLSAKDVIGKKIYISGGSYDWSSGQPVQVENKADDLTIVGVIDTTVKYKSPTGQEVEYELEDSFIYSLDVVKDLKAQARASTDNLSFTIRVKNIDDIMPIVEELQSEGITPMGQFESVKDILSINNTTKEQSSSITKIIALVAIVVTLAVTVINAYLRKNEFAILKINGYSNTSIFNLNIMEHLLIATVSIIVFACTMPTTNTISSAMFNMSVSGVKSILMGSGIIIIQSMVMASISSFIASKTKIEKSLMTGDR